MLLNNRAAWKRVSAISWFIVGPSHRNVRKRARRNSKSEWEWTRDHYDGLIKAKVALDSRVRLRVGATASRNSVFQQTTGEFSYAIFIGGLILTFNTAAVFSISIADLRQHQHTSDSALWVSTGIIIGILVLPISLLAIAARTMDRRYHHLNLKTPLNRLYARVLTCLVATCSVVVLFFPPPDSLFNRFFSLSMLFVVCLFFAPVVNRFRFRAHRRRSPQPSALDTAMIRLFDVTCWIEWCRKNWRWEQRANIARLVGELEQAARESERFATRRVHWWQTSARRDARRAGMKIAAVIRMHEEALVRAASPDELCKIRNSLILGLDAWILRDLDQLTRNAPEIALRDWLRSSVSRLWPAFVLISSGFTLPSLSVFKSSPDAAQNMRITLLVTGAIAAVGGGVAASDRVNAALEKAFSSRKQSSGGADDK